MDSLCLINIRQHVLHQRSRYLWQNSYFDLSVTSRNAEITIAPFRHYAFRIIIGACEQSMSATVPGSGKWFPNHRLNNRCCIMRSCNSFRSIVLLKWVWSIPTFTCPLKLKISTDDVKHSTNVHKNIGISLGNIYFPSQHILFTILSLYIILTEKN